MIHKPARDLMANVYFEDHEVSSFSIDFYIMYNQFMVLCLLFHGKRFVCPQEQTFSSGR